MASIKDVAIAAGVSKTTASDALNNLPKVKEETRKKVLEAARKLDYRPNIAARELIMNRKLSLGIINLIYNENQPEVKRDNEYFTRVYAPSSYDIESVIMSEVSRTRYGLLVERLEINENEPAIPEFLKADRVAGVFVIGTLHSSKYIEMLKEYTTNVIAVGNVCSECDCVSNDYVQAIYTATKYLIDNGHTKIGYINGDPLSQATPEKLRGFKMAMDDYGLEINEDWIKHSKFTGYDGYKKVQEIWESCSERPTAICFSSDVQACGASRYFYEQGILVPDEVSIVGFENTAIAEFMNPSLSTIDKNKKRMGKEACSLMFERLENPERERKHVQVPFALITRKSVKKI